MNQKTRGDQAFSKLKIIFQNMSAYQDFFTFRIGWKNLQNVGYCPQNACLSIAPFQQGDSYSLEVLAAAFVFSGLSVRHFQQSSVHDKLLCAILIFSILELNSIHNFTTGITKPLGANLQRKFNFFPLRFPPPPIGLQLFSLFKLKWYSICLLIYIPNDIAKCWKTEKRVQTSFCCEEKHLILT